MDELLKDFLVETAENIEVVESQLVQFERDPSDARIIGSIFRLVHTIKGTCGFIGLPRLEKVAHSAEALIGKLRDGAPASPGMVTLILSAIDRIQFILTTLESTGEEPEGDDAALIHDIEAEAARDAMAPAVTSPVSEIPAAPARAVEVPAPFTPPAPTPVQTTPASIAAHAEPGRSSADQPQHHREAATIRVTVGTLERIMTLVSELVLTRNQLLEIARHRADDVIKAPLQRLSAVTTDLQEGVMHARMQPIDRLFSNLPRLVRDLSNELGKRIDVVTTGADTELDRQLIELIRDPITHLIRNCADHGLETPAERIRAGKRETGTIRIAAAHDSGYITIEVGDDGRGLDIERIRQKALLMSLAGEAELARMSNDEISRFIFTPGFSTAAKVTSVSGRGVGMDVVRENIEAIGGTVALRTTVGQGTSFTLKIPLTLAIAPALIVRTAGHRFALPQHAVVEAVAIWGEDSSRLESVQGALMLHIRDSVIPVIDLRTLLKLEGEPEAPEEERLAVIMRFGSSAFGVVVDTVSDVQEIVVKPLGRSLSHLTVFSGNTILGDGSVVLILNPNGLATHIGLDLANHYSDAAQTVAALLPSASTRLVVFRAGAGPLKALPLSLVSRIETVLPNDVADIDGMKAIHHLGRLMPVVDIGRVSHADLDRLHVLVIGFGGEPMGLLVSEIVDIVEDAMVIEIAGKTEAVIGSTTIAGEATEIIDLQYYMRIARPDAFARGNARRFTVLLVDDKPFFRDMLSPVIAAAGYEVRTAASGEEVLDLAKRGFVFDALVTDIEMPGMNGYVLAQRLREDPARHVMPIIAIDAYAGPNIVAAASAAGMVAAVGKFDRNALLELLKQHLRVDPLTLQGIERAFLSGVAA